MLMSAGSTGLESAEIDAGNLRWPGSSADQLTFMRAVFNKHVELSKAAGSTFTADLPDRDLAVIEGNHRARKDAAQAATAMLSAARQDLRSASLADRVRIGIVSAYRSASRQFEIWQGAGRNGGFPYYYRRMVASGRLRAGDYGPSAIITMAREIAGWIASPGYSNHQDGLAIDFGTGAVGRGGLGVIGKRAWFHTWLTANAHRFGFRPYDKEPWHWTYRQGSPTGKAVARPAPGGGVGLAVPPAAPVPVAPPVGATAGARGAAHRRLVIPRAPVLAGHRGRPPDVILRWNVSTAPQVMDVVVHLHGYWYAGVHLDRDIEPVSGLDLSPIGDGRGQGRTRPTLTILPRGNDTGVRQQVRRPDGTSGNGPYNVYTFPELIKPNGLNELIRFSLNRFGTEVGGAAPRMGRLILTAHSGGGAALLALLKFHDPHQVHIFDGLYQDAGALAEWANRHIRLDSNAVRGRGAAAVRDYLTTRGGALRVFYQARGGTRGFSTRLGDAIRPGLGADLAPWYRVEASRYNHFQIPTQYGWRVLADAGADVPNISSGGNSHELATASEAAAALSMALEAEARQPAEPVRSAARASVLESELEFPAVVPSDPRIAEALRLGKWGAAVRAALSRGVTDVNQLTNMLFYARHPNLPGRTIRPEQRDLAKDWLQLRDRWVIPAVRVTVPAGPTTDPQSPTGTPSSGLFTRRIPETRRFAALLPLLDRYRGEIPLDFLLGWVAVESGGRIDVVTGLDERGFFQIHPAESRDHRLQHQRLTSDPEYSVQAGVQIVRSYVDLARKRYPWIPIGSDLFWRVVKLQHAMGSGLTKVFLTEMRKTGATQTTWEAIKAFELTSAAKRLHALLRVRPGRFGHNVDEVFTRGARIAKSLGR